MAVTLDGRQAVPMKWTAKKDALLGCATDAEIARQLGVSDDAVRLRRVALKIPSFCATRGRSDRYPAPEMLVALMQEHGSWSAVARVLGVARKSLRAYCERRPDLEAKLQAALATTKRSRVEQKRDANRNWRTNHPETARRLRRDWYRTEKGRASRHVATLRRRAAGMTDEAESLIVLLRADPCSYCGESGGEIDHIVPVARGGDNDPLNLTSACRNCNGRKRDKSLLEFLLA